LHFDTGFTDYLPWQPVSEASRTHCRAGSLAAALDIPAPPRGGAAGASLRVEPPVERHQRPRYGATTSSGHIEADNPPTLVPRTLSRAHRLR
jgi:hypothetical protein